MSDQTASSALTKAELPPTGERFVAQGAQDNIQVAYEHLHRYFFAQDFCRGKRVLDIASGEGYGASLLAQVAIDVVGVELASEVVLHARRKYKRGNLRFAKGDCAKIPLRSASVDVVVSFETIEHIQGHEAFLAEIKRVLTPEGLLIVSSPDKHEYSDRNGYSNPFHVAELYRQDFLRLLKSHFRNYLGFQQRLVAGSYIAADQHGRVPAVYGTYRGNLQGGTFNEGVHEGLYCLALCSDAELPSISAGVFENRFESARIWDWYESAVRIRGEMDELRRGSEELGRRLLANDEQRARLEASLADARAQIDRLEESLRQAHDAEAHEQADLKDRTEGLRASEARLRESEEKAAQLQLQLDEADRRLREQADLVEGLRREQSELLKARSDNDRLHAERLVALRTEVEKGKARLEAAEQEAHGLREALAAEREQSAANAARKFELEDKLALQAQARERTILQTEKRIKQLEADRNDAESHLLAAQTALNEVLKQAEDRLRWGSSLDNELQAARAQRIEADGQREALETEIGRLERTLREKKAECEQKAEKIRRMQDSRSWKITAPLRFVRRLLFD